MEQRDASPCFERVHGIVAASVVCKFYARVHVRVNDAVRASWSTMNVVAWRREENLTTTARNSRYFSDKTERRRPLNVSSILLHPALKTRRGDERLFRSTSTIASRRIMTGFFNEKAVFSLFLCCFLPRVSNRAILINRELRISTVAPRREKEGGCVRACVRMYVRMCVRPFCLPDRQSA